MQSESAFAVICPAWRYTSSRCNVMNNKELEKDARIPSIKFQPLCKIFPSKEKIQANNINNDKRYIRRSRILFHTLYFSRSKEVHDKEGL